MTQIKAWTNGCVTHSSGKYNPTAEIANRRIFTCAHCGNTSHYGFVARDRVFTSYRCYMDYFPMELTGNETKSNQIAKELAENRCSGRGKRKKKC
jgi:hypothetical protein